MERPRLPAFCGDVLLIRISLQNWMFDAARHVHRFTGFRDNKAAPKRRPVCVATNFSAASRLTLGFAAVAANLPSALASLGNSGPYGLSEILYAYASTSTDNGSAFAGLSANTPWYNISTGVALLFGRLAHAVPVLAMAGALAVKARAPASAGTFPAHGPLFGGLLLGVIAIVTLLQYFPALALGPLAEHFLMHAGKTF